MKNKTIFKILSINIIFVVFIAIIQENFNLGTKDVSDSFEEMSFTENLFFGVIFAPLLEEFVFRYPLIKENKKVYISLLFGVLFAFLNNSKDPIVFIGILAINTVTFVYYFFLKKEKVNVYIVFVYLLLFSFSHISNYNKEFIIDVTILGFILQFFPQLITGSILTYMRIKNINYYKIVLYHSSYNFIFLIIEEMYNFLN